MRYKVSVVIAAYNTEKYIQRCLNSVLEQGIDDIQIICVNDASTDRTNEILKQYEDRVEVYSNSTNMGAGYSKNYGLSKCKGEYIVLLDSDDWLVDGSIQYMYELAKRNDADSVYFGRLNVNEATGKSHAEQFMGDGQAEYEIYESGKELLSALVDAGKVSTGTRNLFKKEILNNNIRYSENTLNDDMQFSFWLYKECGRIIYLRKSMYAYFHREKNSISQEAKGVRFWNEYFIILNRVIQEIKKNDNDSLWDKLYEYEIIGCINAYYRMLKTEQNDFMKSLEKNEGLNLIFDKWITKVQYKSQYWDIESKDIVKIKNKTIYLYGAGVYASDLYRVLQAYGVEIKGFIKTNAQRDEMFMGKNVINLDMIDSSSYVIIAVSEKFYDDVMKNLINRFANIITIQRKSYQCV